MKSPIPDSLVEDAPRIAAPRPAALKTLLALEGVAIISGLVYCDGSMTGSGVGADLVYYAVFQVFWLTMLYFIWRGRNWARIIVMIGFVLGVMDLLRLDEYNMLQKAMTVFEAALSMAWLWFLTRKHVVAFFKGARPENTMQ